MPGKSRKRIIARNRNRKYLLNVDAYNTLRYDKHEIYMYKGIRKDSAEKKEPKTIAWIEKDMAPGEVLYDIGANVGAFSLVAAKFGIQVYAFEPSIMTFIALMKNIYKNKCESNIIALNIPLAESTRLDYFYYSDIGIGESGHSFGKADKKAMMKQMMLSTTLDELTSSYSFPVPNHIKLDVDGNEKEVLEGAANTLTNSSLKTILIEAMGKTRKPMSELMLSYSFELDKKMTTDVNCLYRRKSDE